MRLFTAGSLVRAGQGEPKSSGQRNLAGYFLFHIELRANGFASIASGYPDAGWGDPRPPYIALLSFQVKVIRVLFSDPFTKVLKRAAIHIGITARKPGRCFNNAILQSLHSPDVLSLKHTA